MSRMRLRRTQRHRAAGAGLGGGGALPDWFVDSVNGNDGNDGRSAATAYATIGALSAVQSNQRIGLAKGSHFYQQMTAYATGITVQSYGTGARPIIDGSRIIPAISWTVDPDNANVYYADVTHSVLTVPQVSNVDANTFHVAVWEDETLLTGTFGGADIAANRALVDATPGTFTAHRQGQTDKDPRDGTGDTAYRYYVHLSDSGNPASNGAVVCYAEQQAVALLAINGIYRGLEFRRSATKDMVGMADGTQNAVAEVSDCVFRDPGCHGAVIRPRLLSGCYAYGRADGRSKTVGGYGFNFFFGQSEGVYTPAITAQGNSADGFNIGIGSHGAGNAFPTHDSVTLLDTSITDCTTGISIALTLNGVLVDGLSALNCTNGIQTNQDNTTIRNASYLSRTSGACVGVNLWSDALVEDSSFVFATSGAAYLFQNGIAQFNNDATVVQLTLNRVSNKGGTAPVANSRYMQIDLSGEDNVLGKLSNIANNPSLTSIVLQNSYLSERQRTIAEMQAAGNTLTDCLAPWQLESIQRTVGSGDLSSSAIGRTVSSAGAGQTQVTGLQDIDTPNAVRASNWDGAGGVWETYLLSVIPSTGYNLPAAHPTPGAFTNKALLYLYYNKQFVFGRPLREWHANATNNGPSWTVVHGSGVSLSGVQASVLYHLGGSNPRVQGTTGTTASALASQVDAVNGVIDAGLETITGATLTVSAVTDHAADDLIWSGDPDTTGIAILDASSPLYALGMGRLA